MLCHCQEVDSNINMLLKILLIITIKHTLRVHLGVILKNVYDIFNTWMIKNFKY